MTEVVYFQGTADGYVYIGHSGQPHTRNRAHENDGKTLLCALPGSRDAEDILAAFFKADLVRGKSTFQGKDIWNYVEWLLKRRFAYATIEDAIQGDRLPIDVWHPLRVGDHADQNGQGVLLDQLPVRERIALARSDLVHLSSISDEWLTPPYVIDLARRVLGRIGTDPASCRQAQEWIQADRYFTRERDGLSREMVWEGPVWLNPPYGHGGAIGFIQRLVAEMRIGAVPTAITCLNLNSAGAQWFDAVWEAASSHLIWRGRINFVNRGEPDSDTSPSNGTILSYFGDAADSFAEVFSPCGTVVRRYG